CQDILLLPIKYFLSGEPDPADVCHRVSEKYGYTSHHIFETSLFDNLSPLTSGISPSRSAALLLYNCHQPGFSLHNTGTLFVQVFQATAHISQPAGQYAAMPS